MTDKGKILILKLNERLLSLLLGDNRILAAQVQRDDSYAVGNIYIGRVQSIAENIGAAFVDLGEGQLSFLPLAGTRHAVITNRSTDGGLKAGDELLVQVSKEAVGTKLTGVTTRLSLAGKYAVVERRPETADGTADIRHAVQVSSKLSAKRQAHFRGLEALQRIADDCTLIVRTNAGALAEDGPLIAEAESLAGELRHIAEIAATRICYSCLHREPPGYLHFIENVYTSEYDEIVTDIPEIHAVLQEHIAAAGIPVRLYEDSLLPLGKLYAVEERIRELLARKVWLKSGGYLVIEPTEALVSIDVNSGKCGRGKDSEETFFRLNMEAAEMIAVQLRARNLSGMILVDFINMRKAEHNRQLMEYMKSLLKRDSVTADVVDMTGLGLVELTRKKVNPSFREQYGDSSAPQRLPGDHRPEKRCVV